MGLGRFFGKLVAPFKWLFSKAGRERVELILDQVEDITKEALEIVKLIALTTPNRTDDEIVAAAEKFGLNGLQILKANSKPEDALRSIGKLALAKAVYPLKPKDKVLNIAIEAAVVLLEGLEKDAK